MKFSIVIPARNEERYLPLCLASIARAAQPFPGQVETVVVLNRCTDGTERIAAEAGASLVKDDTKSIAHLRNVGAAAAQGEVLVTLDADSQMRPDLLLKIDRALASGRYIGGAVRIDFERYSLGLVVTLLLMLPIMLWYGISGGSFWVRKKDFEALGGFDESKRSFEDVDFALRLKARGRALGLPFKTLWTASIVTSCRKFDQFGDWFMVLNPHLFWKLSKGAAPELADQLWYEQKR